MALTTCSDCGKQVSDKAPACPGCGAPIASATDHRNVGVPLTTVQETSKRLKSQILVSALLFWGGLIMLFSAASSTTTPNNTAMIAPFLMLGGFAWYVVTKFRIWWQHK